ncbi:radical SAM protein [Seleniivibrio sp.]|uniref:radical SAM protein n=1 Tax=Seleniivibrio sp. TaxID=2898801 RepID=UPI0025CC2BDF|nr:radical SAM protein [Seleniivibrio sp.]MCD8554744.1 radical SAM protein [Seleniivibrio sp.]
MINKEISRYERIYCEFEKAVLGEGLAFADDRKAETESLIAEIKALGGTVGIGSKSVVVNRRSAACDHCRTGAGSKTFIISLDCNRDCYFCSNRNQENYDQKINTVFNIKREFEDYSRAAAKVRSVALTGGEPLLYPDECIDFFRTVKRYDRKIHTRLYTNGDLMTDEILKMLSGCIDEIRISLKDTNGKYDSMELEQKLLLAKRYINHVTVEMPVLPDSYDEMIPLLDVMESCEIFSVNLLEFLFPWQRPQEYTDRGYGIKHRPYRILYKYDYAGGLPVDGSEIVALECVRYALKNNFKIGVHYCSLENKLTSQIYSQNAGTKISTYEMFDEDDFFIKSAKAWGEDACVIKRALDSRGLYYCFDESVSSIEFRVTDIDKISPEKDAEAAISYCVTECSGQNKYIREISLNKVVIKGAENEC